MTQPGKKKIYNVAELSMRHQALLQDHNRMAIHVTHLTNAVNAMAEEVHHLADLLVQAGIITMADEPVGQPIEEGAEGLTSVPAEDVVPDVDDIPVGDQA